MAQIIPGQRYVVPNDETGRWEVHLDGAWLAEFESESLAYECAEAPEVRKALVNLVNFNEADPNLYNGDDDGTLGRLMFAANVTIDKGRA